MDIQELRDSNKSWQQDFVSEDGNYVSNCAICHCDFIGHKRRVVCRECQEKLAEKRPPNIIRVVKRTPPEGSFYRSIEQAFHDFWNKATGYNLQDVRIIIDDSPFYNHHKHPPIIIVGEYKEEGTIMSNTAVQQGY
jgi:hypothetical protein